MKRGLLELCEKEGEDKFKKCPICGNDVYISESKNTYACSNRDCLLYNGSSALILKIQSIIL